MSDDELAYLAPGFDLNTLTMPKLRSILVSHDVSYPASAKKGQLIDILTSEVLPKAKRLLSSRARTKRTSKGIEDMPSSQEETVDGEDDEQLMPPPPVPKTPRGRKKKSTGTETSEDEVPQTPTSSRKSKTPGRRSTAKHVRASDTETEDTSTDTVRPSARKTRKSEPASTPSRKSQVKIEEPDLALKKEFAHTDSPFSDDNPFQSGSPGADSRRVSSDSKRRSLGTSSSKDPDRRKSTSRKRQTISPSTTKIKPQDGPSAPSRSTFEFPVSKLEAHDDVQPTEEFTPEEQLELVRARAAEGYSGKDLIPIRRKKSRPASTASILAPWIVLSVLSSAFGYWWRLEKLEIGYCGVGKPRWSLADTQVPDWANVIEPQCEPCPQHAYCYPNLEIRCENDYVKKSHPYSLFGAVPIPPTCEPDGEKVRRIKSVADKAVEELRQRRAEYECGELSSEETVTIAEEDLRQELKGKKSKKMSDDEFDDLWSSAIGDILGREEVVSEGDGSSSIIPGKGGRLLTSTSLARLGLVCSARRRLRLTLSFYRLHLSLLMVAIALFFYARYTIRAQRAATAQIPSLVSLTLDRLATQASLKAGGETEEGWISIGQLRDDVLREVMRVADRERVWKGVRAVVEGNANVRAGTREAASGEWVRVWEWIGPVGKRPIASSPGGGRGGMIDQAPLGNAEGSDGEMIQRSWNEGRPIY